jgi:hypothetical protein
VLVTILIVVATAAVFARRVRRGSPISAEA